MPDKAFLNVTKQAFLLKISIYSYNFRTEVKLTFKKYLSHHRFNPDPQQSSCYLVLSMNNLLCEKIKLL